MMRAKQAISFTSFFVAGTDTGAGKTTFSLLWLHAHGSHWGYFKPVETGDSDSLTLKTFGPLEARVLPPVACFQAPLAPHRAAKAEGRAMPSIEEVLSRLPEDPHLVEGFGGAHSPWNDDDLLIDFVARSALPVVLVGSTALGGVGRMISTAKATIAAGVRPKVLVLLGPDEWTAEQIARRLPEIPLVRLEPPAVFTRAHLAQSAKEQQVALERIAEILTKPPQTPDNELLRRDAASIWHPYAPIRLREAPLAVTGAQDEFLHLADGRKVVDAISSWWTILYGHQGTRLSEFLARGNASIDHVQFAGLTHHGAVDLAEILLETARMQQGRVFYSDNGSTAIEVAMKIAWMHWRKRGESQRDLFVGFEGAYHGDTFATMAIARHPLFTKGFEKLMFEARTIPIQPAALDALLLAHPGRVAAVVLEPMVQGVAGMAMQDPATLAEIFALCRKHNTLFIADEVMTGGGRTGRIWAHQHALGHDDHPDLIAAGKTLGGGFLPLAATLVSPRIVDSLNSDDPADALFHGHSFTAHALACTVGAAAWKKLAANGPVEALGIESFWKSRLAPLASHPAVKELRILGAIAAIELNLAAGYISPVRAKAVPIGLDHGILWRPLGNVIYALPPYCSSPESLERIAAAFFAVADQFTGE